MTKKVLFADIESRREIESRFWDRVNVLSPDECWLWKLKPHKKGYAIFWFHGAQYRANRMSYELCYGEIAEGLYVDHKCRNRMCVNPLHLQAVTNKENTENRGVNKNSPFGVRGVTRRSNGKFRARVGHRGKVIHIGDFNTLEEAEESVRQARLKIHTNNLEDRGAIYE